MNQEVYNENKSETFDFYLNQIETDNFYSDFQNFLFEFQEIDLQ